METSDTRAKTKRFVSTLDRVLVALLLVVGLLFLSDQYDWFAFNRNKGWTVLIAVAVVVGALLLMGLGTGWSWAASRWTNRKPFQFGLRPAMLVMVVVGVVCGWFASAWNEAQKQRAVLGEVRGIVIRSGQSDTPAWLGRIFGDDFFTEAVELQLGEADLSDNFVSNGRSMEFRPTSLLLLLRLPRLKRVVLLNFQPDGREVEALKARGIEVQSVMTW